MISQQVVHAHEQPVFFLVHNRSQLIAQEGFAAGTLIRTPDGYSPIEMIERGTRVCSYDFKNGAQTERRVLHVSKVCITDCVIILYGDETIYNV